MNQRDVIESKSKRRDRDVDLSGIMYEQIFTYELAKNISLMVQESVTYINKFFLLDMFEESRLIS